MQRNRREFSPSHAVAKEHARQSIKRLQARMKHMDDITQERAQWTIEQLRKQHDL